jgi:chromate reductase, NAD(P)H dehydrogenase (quinone)
MSDSTSSAPDAPAPESTVPDRIIVFAGSARRDSVNKHVARIATDALVRRGRDAVFVDLADYEMPLYHGDQEEDRGIPEAAHRLTELFATAGGFLISSPEYNGAMTALLKNTVDWITRVEFGAFGSKFIGLMAATPGRLGGANSLRIIRQWFEYMRLTIADAELALPLITSVLQIDGETARLDDESTARLEEFLDAYLVAFDLYRNANAVGSPTG